MNSTLKIPYGDSQGQLITECALGDLEWMLGRIEKRLCELKPGATYKYEAQDRAWAEEAARVLKDRKAVGEVAAPRQPQAQPRSLALAPPPAEMLAKVTRSMRSAAEATALLAEAKSIGHLISPAPAVGSLPDGCSVSVSALMVDPNRETYPQPGSAERGLGKVALDRIGGAAGIEWDDQRSGRVDDRSNPWYCHCKAVGRVRRFDGTWRPLFDECEIDMSPGGTDYEAIIAREERKKRDEGTSYRGDGGKLEIAQRRKFILRLCTTGARLRATRQLGIRTSYTAEELTKPFIMVQLVFDGHSEDAESRKYYRERIADSFLGAAQSLYGGAAPQLQKAEPRVIDLPAEPEEEPDFGPPDYGFPDPPRRTGTGGPY